jgi:hypothetical protein
MKTIIAVTLLLFAGAAQAQEHAHPSPDLCRANARSWEDQALVDKKSVAKSLAKLGIREIYLRNSEMAGCLMLDGNTQNEIERYQFVLAAYVGESERRHHHFIVRHNLDQQFLDEDAAGQR